MILKIMDSNDNFDFELNLERSFRKLPWFIPMVSLVTGLALFTGIAVSLHYFKESHYWTIIPAGLLAHAFFIVIVHDASHKSITKTKFDRLLMNVGSGLMLLPFYGEPFRKYHLIHHGNTNSEIDLWPKHKKSLYENRRWLYILCECIPLLFTIYLLSQANKTIPELKEKKIANSLTVNIPYMVMSACISLLIIFISHPSSLFCLGTIFVLNIFGTLRHWCEHLGTDQNKTSNTFWFPLGMGIGNHDAHHHSPHVSWIVLLIGLFYREKTTSPLKTLYGVLFNKSFIHYKER